MTNNCSWNYHDLLSYCGLVDATISASEKELPVQASIVGANEKKNMKKYSHQN